VIRASTALEHLPPCRQHVVQRFLEMNRRLGKLATDLLHVFLIALLDLVAEQLLERTALEALIPFGGIVSHHV